MDGGGWKMRMGLKFIWMMPDLLPMAFHQLRSPDQPQRPTYQRWIQMLPDMHPLMDSKIITNRILGQLSHNLNPEWDSQPQQPQQPQSGWGTGGHNQWALGPTVPDDQIIKKRNVIENPLSSYIMTNHLMEESMSQKGIREVPIEIKETGLIPVW